jgi:tRNA G18 (ribose-2'-O)-methylase SpoU
MPVVHSVNDLNDPRVAEYHGVPAPELLCERGLFVAEGRLVVRRLLEDGSYRTRSRLVTEAARASLADVLGRAMAELPIYVVSLDAMRAITCFSIHRGCLALVERNAPIETGVLVARLSAARLLVVLEEVANADNVGGVFRNALAFGAAAVLLSPGCCDPLYRKAIRTSMAASLRVPFARVGDWPRGLGGIRAAGFSLVALTPAADARDLGDFASDPRRPSRLALMAGAEGPGLSAPIEAMADARVRIPMAPGVDSLNLATATGIALYRLGETSSE